MDSIRSIAFRGQTLCVLFDSKESGCILGHGRVYTMINEYDAASGTVEIREGGWVYFSCARSN